MRSHEDAEEVDFIVVGTGAGGGTLSARLAEKGFSVVAFDAGPFFRPLEDFASDEEHQSQLYWLDERIVDGADPIKMGGNNCGKAVGGSTVHFAMVSLRFRPEHFKARSRLGYGADWPVDWREMWRYYDEVERALSISGPLSYPWGPPRPAYPYRAHPLNACAQSMAVGCERLGVKWAPIPLATVSAPRGASPPCVQRGFCRFGCSTNAKQSALTVWIPRALKAGAEIRDLAMVGRIELATDGRATGVHYHREGGVAVPAGASRGGRRLRGRDAAPAVKLRLCAGAGRAGQQFGPGRPQPDDPVEPGRLRPHGGGRAVEQGAAKPVRHRALELRGTGTASPAATA